MRENRRTFTNAIYASLSQFWKVVTPIEPQEQQQLHQSFVSVCIVDSFKQKFAEEYGRTVKRRSFQLHKVINLHSRIDALLNVPASGDLTVKVTWAGGRQPLAYSLEGRPTTLDKIFVDEGDAIAQLSFSSNLHYLFLDGATGELLSFPSRL